MIRPAALCLALALLPTATPAQVVVLDYDGAPTPDFAMGSYEEDGVVTTVQSGHYEIITDALGPEGDHAFNIDDESHGVSSVRIAPAGGSVFDALSLDIVNPASAAGEITIAAVGGPGGSISAPITGGTVELDETFRQITALDITQNQPGAFTFDNVVLPEPGRAGSFLLLAGTVVALWARRER